MVKHRLTFRSSEPGADERRNFVVREKETLYEKIYQEILGTIQHGQVAPGDRLGSETEIAQRFGVSRITSKRALDQLAHDGYIVRRPGRGSYVREENAIAEEGEEAALVAVVMPELSPSYGVRLLASLHYGLRQAGFDMMLGLSHGSQAVESEEIDRFSRRSAAGFVIFPVNGEYHNAGILRLHLDGVPLVLVDKPLAKIRVSAVWSENEQAGFDATQFLLDGGHRRIAFLSPPMANTETLESRYAGYERAMREADITVDPKWVVDDLPSEHLEEDANAEQRRYDGIVEFLKTRPGISAVLAAEYRIGLDSLKALRALEVACPEGVSVVTFDGPWPIDASAQLTHMRQDEWTMGQTAVRLLVTQIANRNTEAEQIAIPVRLVEGVTTRPLIYRDVNPAKS